MKIRKVDGFSNYDKSEFSAPTPLLEDDEKLEEVWKKQHSLTEFTDPKNFKNYEELKEKMERVLGLTPTVGAQQTFTNTVDVSKPPFDGGKPIKKEETVTATAESEDSDEYSYFAKLAEDE